MTLKRLSNSFTDQYPAIPLKFSGDEVTGLIQNVAIEGIIPSITLGALTNYTSLALEASEIVKATAGKLFVVSGYSTADQYIQIFDSATLPADGAIPAIVIEATAGSTFGYTAPNLYGRSFANGIVICNSSTGASKTIGGSTILMDVQFL